jgi:hypothetical protein
MFKFKLGAIFGFALGWLVGSGRAATLWDDIQGSATRRTGSGSGPVVLPDRTASQTPAARDVRTATGLH